MGRSKRDRDNRIIVQVAGLKWVGRNRDGISMWRGTWRSIPKWFCNLFKVLGIGLICLSGIFALTGIWAAVPGPLIAGCFHSMLAFVFFERFRNRMDSLMTQEQVAEQLGVSVDDVKKAVEEAAIKPEYILNDEPVYGLHAFGDAGLLLRSSEAPVDDSTLLRAASGLPNDNRTDTLLRPANGFETMQASERTSPYDFTAAEGDCLEAATLGDAATPT